ncbi:MAG: RDD family protein [Planctomycetota bacterium]|nr:RDD family protein [Planctomycetota bacterium]
MDNINPYQAPPETIDVALNNQPPLATDSIEYASRWLRLGGALIDMVIVLPIFMTLCVWCLLDVSAKTLEPWSFEKQFYSLLIGLAVFLMLNGILIYTRGQTIGKLICRTVVVNKKDFSQVSGNRYIFLRFLPIAIVNGIPFISMLFNFINSLAIFRPEKNCLHDDIAGTRVIMRDDLMRLRN